MITKEERVRDIIRIKKEKVKRQQIQQAIKKADSAIIHMSRGVRDLSDAAEILLPYTLSDSVIVEAVGESRRMLSKALNELLASI